MRVFVVRRKQVFVRIAMTLSCDAIQLLSRVKLSEVFVGVLSTGSFFEDRITESGVKWRATKCLIYEFFTMNGAPALVSRICELDKNWMKSIQESRHGVTIARTITIAASETRH